LYPSASHIDMTDAREGLSYRKRARIVMAVCPCYSLSLFERVASHVGLEAFGRGIPMMWVLQREASVALEAAGAPLANSACTPQFGRIIYYRSSCWSMCSYVVSSTRWSTPEYHVPSQRYIIAPQPCLSAEVPWFYKSLWVSMADDKAPPVHVGMRV